jgi:hypothetical protein
MDLMTDVFNGFVSTRLTDFYIVSLMQTCHKKCIPPSYKQPELNKGESVCTDRCVAKYLEVRYFAISKFSGLRAHCRFTNASGRFCRNRKNNNKLLNNKFTFDTI